MTGVARAGRVSALRRWSCAAIRWSGLWLPALLNACVLATLLFMDGGPGHSDPAEVLLGLAVIPLFLMVTGATPLYALFGLAMRSLLKKYPGRWVFFGVLLLGIGAIPLCILVRVAPLMLSE